MSSNICSKPTSIQCSISLYPMGSTTYTAVVKDCIQHLAVLAEENNVQIFYHTMNTSLYGNKDAIFSIIRQFYFYAEKRNPDIVLNVSYSNCCPEP